MKKYAEIDNSGLVIGIVETKFPDAELHPNLIETDEFVLGKLWTGTEFVTPPDTNTYLYVTAPANPLAINTNITVNVAIKDASGNIVNVNGTYYVPVVQKVSNVAIDLLDINLVNGQATKTFQISAKGIYSIMMSAVSPVPTSILADNVELIVI